MFVYGINGKCEWPLEAADIERASVGSVGQGIVQVVYSNAFHRKTFDWVYGN